jgi:tetratricopeptide (TPR) repeat protein
LGDEVQLAFVELPAIPYPLCPRRSSSTGAAFDPYSMSTYFNFKGLVVAAAFVSASHMAYPDEGDDLIKKGDVHYEQLQTADALKYYLPAEKLQPKNVDLLVKISREYRHLMSDAGSKEEKVRLGNIAKTYAQRAVALAPNDPEAQLAIAITYGKLLPYQSNKERVEGSKIVKEAAEKVTRLAPSNDLGWHLLGRWHVTMADVGAVTKALGSLVYGKMPPSSNEDAERYFLKAISLNPNRLMHYIELGRTYAQMGRKDEARKFITKGLAMPATEKDDPETKQKGREILAKLK